MIGTVGIFSGATVRSGSETNRPLKRCNPNGIEAIAGWQSTWLFRPELS